MENKRKLGWLFTLALWVPSVLLGLLFVAQGIFKLQPGSPWPEMFSDWGLPAGFYLVIGLVELAGGVALLVPRFADLGGAVLAAVMLGACMTHLVHQEWSNSGFTAGFMVALGILAWRHRVRKRRSVLLRSPVVVSAT